jgi:uncharacterized protein
MPRSLRRRKHRLGSGDHVNEVALPTFRYHPDPIATGAVTASAAACIQCQQARGYIYTGPAYAVEELDNEVCPWCIADGSAASVFEASFTETDGDVSDDVRGEIEQRTPGFSGWQQERWLTHCGDGCAYLGIVTAARLAAMPDGAVTAARAALSEWLGAPYLDEYLLGIAAGAEPSVYLFQCLHCQEFMAYADAS